MLADGYELKFDKAKAAFSYDGCKSSDGSSMLKLQDFPQPFV
jgi:hypothetical protein